MTDPFHVAELWSFVWFRIPQWERHPVIKVTSTRVWMKAPSTLRQAKMGVDRAAIEKCGRVRCSALQGDVFTEAAMRAEQRKQAIEHEELRRVLMANGFDVSAPRSWPGAGGFVGVGRGAWPPGPVDRVTGILWPTSATEVRKTFRQLAKTKHPDAGGSAQEFIALQKSYEQALRLAVSP